MGTKKTSSPGRGPAALGVADALFTSVRQRVLAILFGNAGRSFYANEVIALAGSGSGAVQRELARLEQAGLVTVTRVGNQKHYRANERAPVFPELRSLVLKTVGLADVLRDALLPLSARIRAAFVFGSVARAEDVAASDVDVMIVSDDVTYPDLFGALEEAAERLGRKVNPTIYTTAELARRVDARNAFVTRVLDGPRIWLIGGESDLATR